MLETHIAPLLEQLLKWIWAKKIIAERSLLAFQHPLARPRWTFRRKNTHFVSKLISVAADCITITCCYCIALCLQPLLSVLHYSNFFVAFFSRLFLRENRNLSPLRPKMYKVQSFLLPSCLSRQRQTVSFFLVFNEFYLDGNAFCKWSLHLVKGKLCLCLLAWPHISLYVQGVFFTGS